jgi:hypothetical protein
VIELRRDGARIKLDEIESPRFGELCIGDSETRAFKRNVRIATFRQLTAGFNHPTDVFMPLFEPVVTVINSDSLVIVEFSYKFSKARRVSPNMLRCGGCGTSVVRTPNRHEASLKLKVRGCSEAQHVEFRTRPMHRGPREPRLLRRRPTVVRAGRPSDWQEQRDDCSTADSVKAQFDGRGMQVKVMSTRPPSKWP